MKVFMWQNNMCVTYLLVFKKMEDFLRANNCAIVETPEEADWILVGSCGSFYLEINSYFKHLCSFLSMKRKVAIYGCLPRIAVARYREVSSDVALYISTENPESIEKMLPSVLVKWNDIAEAYGFRDGDYRQPDVGRRYVVIQYGCNSTCVFCPHKIGIGSQKSILMGRILEQMACIAAQPNVETVFLEGRDTGSWGTDLNPPETFPRLLKSILSMDADFALYINQLGGNWVVRYAEELLPLLLHPRIVNIHIPIQTTSDRILRLMGRESGILRLKEFFEVLRQRKERPILRTDILVGFPTETEEELTNTLEFVSRHFDEVACYGFELHPLTEIAHKGLQFHDQNIINERVTRAVQYFRMNPSIIVHRGGQDPASLLKREKRKAELGRK